MSKIKQVVFKPSEPLEYAGKTYAELTFKRPKVGHMVAMDAVTGDMEKSMAFLAAMAGVPLPVLLELDLEEIDRLNSELEPMTGSLFDKGGAAARVSGKGGSADA